MNPGLLLAVALLAVLVALVICSWLLGTTHAPQPPPRPPVRVPARLPAQRPARPAPQPPGVLELPPGPAGHLAAAEALHRATGMYLDECERRYDDQ